MKAKYKTPLSILTIAVAFTAGVYSRPAKIETKIVEVIKTVKEEAKTRVVYRDKVTKPDGTIIEKESEREDTNSKELSQSDKRKDNIVTNDKGLVLSVLGTVNLSDIKSSREYSIMVTKRVIGALNIAGGATVSEDGDIKVSGGLGWSF